MYPALAERSSGSSTRAPNCVPRSTTRRKPGVADRRLASILDEAKLRRVLAKMLDENEFLSPYGIRSLSRYHADHPYVIHAGGQEYRVAYLPAESDTGMFGGNSNWRGPIWMPVNALLDPCTAATTSPTTATDSPWSAPPAPAGSMNLLPGRRGDRPSAGEHLPQGQGRPAAGLRRGREVPATTRTGAIAFSSTSISTATTAPGSAPATRQAGPASSPAACTCSRPCVRKTSKPAAGRPISKSRLNRRL